MQWVAVYEVAMKPDRRDDSDAELDMMVQAAKAHPDFVKGWWFGDDKVGFAVQVVTDEAAARRATEGAVIPEEATVSLISAKAYPLMREA